MKILYIDHHAALPSSGGDCRAVQLAQGWQQCGDEVTIVTAGYSHRRGKNLTVEKEMEEQQLEGVTFARFSLRIMTTGWGSTAKACSPSSKNCI